MTRILSLAALAALAFSTAGQSQEPGSGPVASALKSSLQRVTRAMPAAAELMPSEKYGYKPTPEQMSFGEILAHESQSNEVLCGALAGSAPAVPDPAGATATKEQLVERIKKSFENCGTAINQVNEATLADSVAITGGRKLTRARAMIALAQDWADHYAQAAMYLRANGILPPTAKPRS